MDEGVDARRLLGLLALVLVASVVASFGFNALTQNPLVPDADLAIADHPDPAALNESGPSAMLLIEHRGGEAMPLADLELVVGSRADGLVLSADGDWTETVSGVTYRVDRADGPIEPGATLAEGDVIVLRKIEGTLSVGGFEALVRVFHRPSNSVVGRATVAIE